LKQRLDALGLAVQACPFAFQALRKSGVQTIGKGSSI
jgi:hypothetical protein